MLRESVYYENLLNFEQVVLSDVSKDFNLLRNWTSGLSKTADAAFSVNRNKTQPGVFGISRKISAKQFLAPQKVMSRLKLVSKAFVGT